VTQGRRSLIEVTNPATAPRIEIDDAYIGGERTGEGSGRGRRGHTPFIIAVETTADRRPL
jgi:hypothetical protein